MEVSNVPDEKNETKMSNAPDEKNETKMEVDTESVVQNKILDEALIKNVSDENDVKLVRKLDLSDQGLEVIPKELLSQMKALEELNLSENKLKEFPDIPVECLEALDLSYNDISDVSFVKNLPKLNELYLEGNKSLTKSDAFIAAVLCPTLEMIDNVSGNLKKMVDSFHEKLFLPMKGMWSAGFASQYQTEMTPEKEKEAMDALIDCAMRNKDNFDHPGSGLEKYHDFMIKRVAADIVSSWKDKLNQLKEGVASEGTSDAFTPTVKSQRTVKTPKRFIEESEAYDSPASPRSPLVSVPQKTKIAKTATDSKKSAAGKKTPKSSSKSKRKAEDSTESESEEESESDEIKSSSESEEEFESAAEDIEEDEYVSAPEPEESDYEEGSYQLLTKQMVLDTAGLTSMEEITKLVLCDKNIERIPASVMKDLKNLKELNLSGNKLKKLPNVKMEKLETLDLTKNVLENVLYLKHYPKLRVLYLEGNEILTRGDKFIAVALCPELEVVDNLTGNLRKTYEGYRDKVSGPIKIFWDARFSEKYKDGFPKKEEKKIMDEFNDAVSKRMTFGHLELKTYHTFMVRRATDAIVSNAQKKYVPPPKPPKKVIKKKKPKKERLTNSKPVIKKAKKVKKEPSPVPMSEDEEEEEPETEGPLPNVPILTVAVIQKKAKGKELGIIRRLTFQNRGLEKIPGEVINQLKRIEELNFSNNKLTEFPEVKLKRLEALDLSDNDLKDIRFVKHFPALTELYIDGNKSLTKADKFIAVALCPTLETVDSISGNLRKMIQGYHESISIRMQAFWDADFSETHKQGIPKEKEKEILESYIKAVHEKVQFEHIGGGLKDYHNFMVERAAKEIIDKAQNPKKAKKRLRDTDVVKYFEDAPVKLQPPKSKPTPKKVRRSLSSDKPKFSLIKKPEVGEKLPDLPDYDPVTVLRCHSDEDKPSDSSTKVWACALRPDSARSDPGNTYMATCGGESVCFINCSTGIVMGKYKHQGESFYALAWSILKKKDSDNRTYVLAAGGNGDVIHLIDQDQRVCFSTLSGHKKAITTLKFHPRRSTILFSGSSDSRIIIWDIGIPHKTCSTKLQTLVSPAEDVMGILIMHESNYLISGNINTDCLFVWNLELKQTNKPRSAEMELLLPNANGDDEIVEGLCRVGKDLVATKCAQHGMIYIWSFFGTVGTKTKGRCFIKPLMYLNWRETAETHMGIHSSGGYLVAGDDIGNIWMYQIDTALKRAQSQAMQPSRIIEWPVLELGSDTEDKGMVDLPNCKGNIINSVAISPDGKYLISTTDNNLVYIWKKS